MKSSYTNPRKNSKTYKLLLKLKNSNNNIYGYHVRKQSDIGIINYLCNMCGYEIIRTKRGFYKCIGRWEWDGEYIDYILNVLKNKKKINYDK